MMLRNSTLLFHLLLLITMRVCLINGGGDHVNGSGGNLQTTTSSVNGATEPDDRSNIDAVPPDQATDPNAKPASKWSLQSILSSLPDWKTVKRKLTPNWSNMSPGLKKIVPDWNKWKGRYSSCFNKPPRNFEGTLKVKKVSLITFHVLMDKHLFEGTANPYGFHIRHFDVRRHILASTHIKLPKEGKKATSIKLMRIFERFLRECVEPLLILYQKRLDIQRGKELSKSNAATSTSEAPLLVSKGKRRFKLPKISMPNFLPRRNRNKDEKKSDEPSQDGENKSTETANQANSAESAATERQDSQTPKPAPEPKPKVPMKQKIAEKSKKVAGQVGNGLLKGVKVGLTQGLKYTAKGTGFAIALPFKVAIKGKKIVEDEVIDRVSEKMIDKGWKRPPEERILKPLSYPQKAFLYRLLVWLNKMVFIDDFNPCSVAKEKLRYILVTFSLNVLDPEQGYIKTRYRSYDCVPYSAEDLEKCKDTQNDLMVEHLLKISTKYERSVEQNETENYLDYPTYADRFAIIYFIDAFHDEKYVEFFKMTPNMAKSNYSYLLISLSRFNKRKYK